jgi:hypothetical protein
MTKILKWNQFLITELFNNEKLVKSYSTRISEEIRRISPSAKFRDTLTIVNLKEEECVEVEKILKSWEKRLQNEDFVFSWMRNDSCFAADRISYLVFFKSKNTRRIKPQRYVFHCSYSPKEDILKFGLTPKASSESKQWDNSALKYEPAIFATNGFGNLWNPGAIIYQIDTANLKNKWYEDLNFEPGTSNAIMTYEPILPEHITALTLDEFEKLRKNNIQSTTQTIEDLKLKLDTSIKDGDLETLKSLIDEHKDYFGSSKKLLNLSLQGVDMSALLSKSSKFGALSTFKYLYDNFRVDSKNPEVVVFPLLMKSEQYKNFEVFDFLKKEISAIYKKLSPDELKQTIQKRIKFISYDNKNPQTLELLQDLNNLK